MKKSGRERLHLARLKNAAAKHYQTCRSQNSIKTQLEGPTAGAQFPERWYYYKLHYAPGWRFHTGPPAIKQNVWRGWKHAELRMSHLVDAVAAERKKNYAASMSHAGNVKAECFRKKTVGEVQKKINVIEVMSAINSNRSQAVFTAAK